MGLQSLKGQCVGIEADKHYISIKCLTCIAMYSIVVLAFLEVFNYGVFIRKSAKVQA